MLDRLLESRTRRGYRVAGVVISVCAHTGLIAAAVYATAQARSAPSSMEVPSPVYYVPAKVLLTQPAHQVAPAIIAARPHERPILRFLGVPTINVRVPAVVLHDATTGPNDFSATRLASVGGLEGHGSNVGSGQAFSADQVEPQVEAMPGNPSPIYPRVLRETGIEGKVIATFVVNAAGSAEDSTVRFGGTDDALFADAVRTALKRMRFAPAEASGRKVRQWVQMPFVFKLRE